MLTLLRLPLSAPCASLRRFSASPCETAKILPYLETEIVKRSDHANGFVVLPRRWIVERTIAWLNRCRRLAKDWENLNR
jgi:transposase